MLPLFKLEEFVPRSSRSFCGYGLCKVSHLVRWFSAVQSRGCPTPPSTMAKRHRKRPGRSEEDELGCIWSFITMFDYRSGHKLLPERKHGNGTGYSKSKFDIVRHLKKKPESFNDDNQTEENVTLGSESIRTLIEEEMSAHSSMKFSNPEDGNITPNLRFGGNLEKNYKQTDRGVLTSNLHEYESKTSVDKSSWSNCTNKTVTDAPSVDHDLAALMLENNPYQEKQTDFINKIDLLAPGSNHPDELTDKLTQKHVIHRKGGCSVIEDFQNHKSTDAEQFIGSEELYQCKELMDALESPNVNNDLFLKFLEDPNLHFLKHLQELQNVQAGKVSAMDFPKNHEGRELLDRDDRSGKTEDMVRHTAFHIQNAFFWKKHESKLTKPSDNRIVILKPNPARNQSPSIFTRPVSSPRSDHSLQRKKGTERIGSNFSLKEIKRKLWRSNGENRKEALLITSDRVLRRIPNGSLDSADMGKISSERNILTGLQSQTSCTNEHTARPCSKLRDQNHSTEECKDDDQQMLDTKPDIQEVRYSPTIKLKLEMDASHLNSLQQNIASAVYTDICRDDEPKVFDVERETQLKECQDDSQMLDTNPGLLDTPKVSPVDLIQEMDDTNLNPLKQDTVSALWTDICQDDEPKMPDSNPGPLDTHIQLGNDKILEENIDTCMEESETSERCTGEEITSALLSGFDSTEKRPQQIISSDFILCSSELVQKLEVPQFYFKNPEHLSPVSVLGPFSSEDINSPGNTTFEHSIQTRQPQFEEEPENYDVVITSRNSGVSLRACTEEREVIFEYVRSLMEASGISYDKLLKRDDLSDILLDPFLFDEARILSSNLPDAPKLLFDCTNEVLVDIWERYYRCRSWLSIIKPYVRISTSRGNLIQEVCKDIDQRLDSHVTLDQMIRKDLRCETWMNHGHETESTVFEIGNAILEDLIDEIVLIL